MKKITCIFLLLILLTGCGNNPKKTETTTAENESLIESATDAENEILKPVNQLYFDYTIYFNLTDFSKEQQEKLIEISKTIDGDGQYTHYTNYAYKYHLITGDISETDHKLTINEAKQIIEKYKEQGLDKILNEFIKIQPYPDKIIGSGLSYIYFISDNNYDNPNREVISIELVNKNISCSYYDVNERKKEELYNEHDYINH